MSPPAIIAIGGLSGTGKSVLARALAPRFAPLPGAILLRSDVERKNLFGVRETERLPSQAYQADVTAQVYANLAVKAACLAHAGYSVIVDAVFAKPSERVAIETTARDGDIAFLGLFLTASLDARLQRARDRRLDASDADAAVVLQQENYDVGQMAWSIIDASGSPTQTCDAARAYLNETGVLVSSAQRH
jgi:predicted kinase